MCQPRLPVTSEQAGNCFCFPLQRLLCQPCRGAAGDSRHHSLPWLLSLASDWGQRTLKPLQLRGLARLALVCGHGAGYRRRRRLCGSSGHLGSPILQRRKRLREWGFHEAKLSASECLFFWDSGLPTFFSYNALSFHERMAKIDGHCPHLAKWQVHQYPNLNVLGISVRSGNLQYLTKL